MKKRAEAKAEPQDRRRRLDRFVGPNDAEFLAEQIEAIATLMWALAERMEYFGGFNGLMVEHSREMAGASVIARKWATAIRKPNPSHHAEPRLGGDSVDGVVGHLNK